MAASAVLSVGGFLGLNEKYIAVPLNALTPAPGEDHLILDADKQRLERAPGFAKNKWPDLDAPAWGAATGFASTSHQARYPTAAGTSGQSSLEKGSGTAHSQESEYSGKITDVNLADRTLTLKGDNGDKKFTVADDAKLYAGPHETSKLEDLKVGSKATVQYEQQGDKEVARSVHSSESEK